MRLISLMIVAATVGALGILSHAHATPLLGDTADLKAGAADPTIEKAAYRRCWLRHGYRVCRWVGYRDYDYDDGYYGYGYGYGPSIGFRFGGGGHFHGGHGHHR